MFLPRDPSTKAQVQSAIHVVTPEYFRAMRLRVTEGRAFQPSDTDAATAIVVNRTFASRYLGSQPLGQRLNLGLANVRESEVVGVVDDMRLGSSGNETSMFGGVLDPPLPEIFISHRQWPFPIEDLIVVIRTAGDPAALAATARAIVRDEDPALPVDSDPDDGGPRGGEPGGPAQLRGVSGRVCAVRVGDRRSGTLRRAVVHDVATDTRDRTADGARRDAQRHARARWSSRR